MRNSIHGNFERNGDLLFDLLRRNARPLRDDIHIVVRDVRIGFYGKLVEGNGSPKEKQNRRREHEEAVL
jgi:hypothetical protein